MRAIGVIAGLFLGACGATVETSSRPHDDAGAGDGATTVDAGRLDDAAPLIDASDAATAASDADARAHCEPPPISDPCDCRAGAASCSSETECAPLAACTDPFRYDPGACFKDFRLSGTNGCAASSDGAALCCASFFGGND